MTRLVAGVALSGLGTAVPGANGSLSVFAAEPTPDEREASKSLASRLPVSGSEVVAGVAESKGPRHADVPLHYRLDLEPAAAFTAPLITALDEITNCPDPRWSQLVTDNLRLFRAARPGELPDGAFAGMLVGDGGGTAIFASTRADAPYLASVIVHEAWHYHQFAAGTRYYGRAAEQEAMQVQVDVLRSLAPGHQGISYLEEWIPRIGDGGPLPGNPPR